MDSSLRDLNFMLAHLFGYSKALPTIEDVIEAFFYIN